VAKPENVLLTSLYPPHLSSKSEKAQLDSGYCYEPKKYWNLFSRNKIMHTYEENSTKKIQASNTIKLHKTSVAKVKIFRR